MRFVRPQPGLALLALAFACGPGDPPPAELFQTWRNPHPDYRDRHLELRRDFVIFGTGAGASSVHAIASIEAESGAGTGRYVVRYRASDGSLVPLRLAYTGGSEPRLQIGARPDLWVAAVPSGARP